MTNNQLYPTDLTDRKSGLYQRPDSSRPRGNSHTLEMRAVVNAILYLLITGWKFRMQPQEYPAWQSVYSYFRQWRDDGTGPHIHDTLRAQVRERTGRHKHPTDGALASQNVKTSQVGGKRGYDADKMDGVGRGSIDRASDFSPHL